ncbi:MAG TPA: hypothetical protein VEI07_05920 [Planctomycetaceae bacterium]|nr:hypothetical protein [Planctomycetaceae bacterium]
MNERSMGRRDNTSLPTRVTCPHCWLRFAPEEIKWIAAHSDLVGDPLLGSDAPQRFLPSRFNVEGLAIDVKGVACHLLACPRCHLTVPRAVLEMEPLFVSVLGAPYSGKSYFLASMTWRLRRTLTKHFCITFADADPQANLILNGYEEKLFLNAQPDQIVALEKTQLEGYLYETVRFGDRSVSYPRPFVFSLRPRETHPSFHRARQISRAICLYDNAGEHFLPGDYYSPNRPGTDHLAVSRALLFLFDPTQHQRFRQACAGKTNDPQFLKALWSHRQDQVLLEAGRRIRAHTGLGEHDKMNRPLIVVMTKYDAWSALMNNMELRTATAIRETQAGIAGLDQLNIQRVSDHIRAILTDCAPEIVAAAEALSSDVTYLPVSALGHRPQVDEASGGLGVRPSQIRPMWAEIPLLCAIQRSVPELIPVARNVGEPQTAS